METERNKIRKDRPGNASASLLQEANWLRQPPKRLPERSCRAKRPLRRQPVRSSRLIRQSLIQSQLSKEVEDTAGIRRRAATHPR